MPFAGNMYHRAHIFGPMALTEPANLHPKDSLVHGAKLLQGSRRENKYQWTHRCKPNLED